MTPLAFVRRRLPLTAVLLLCLLGTGPAAAAPADDAVRDEYQVKAAFLFNFVKFVQWPDADGALVIGVIGDSPIEAPLRLAVRGRNASGRTLEVRRLEADAELRGVHVVYISEAEARRTPDILRRADRLAVLTVGDSVPFLREGGMIRFFVEQNRVRFQINAGAADRAGLRINSQLLSLAAGQ